MTPFSKLLIVPLALLVACGPVTPAIDQLSPVADGGLIVPNGYQVELYATGLNGPTQMILGPDGRLWLAQLAGPENAGAGQVLALDLDEPEQRRVLLEGLSKPTGIAFLDDYLWIAAGRDLLRARLGDDGLPSQPEVILDQLPFNGRSNGTLTVTPERMLLFETSGSRRGGSAVEGSASLWLLDPEDPTEPELLASGFKNAYAHAFDEQGRLWVTEIADDPVNGMQPPDELNLVVARADYGWPACFADRQPATNYGGTVEGCSSTVPAVAVLPAQSTPTGVVVSPWEDDTLLVAQWGPTAPSVVRVRIEFEGTAATAVKISTFLTGLAHPQSLLVLPDGSVLVSDFESGNVYRLTGP